MKQKILIIFLLSISFLFADNKDLKIKINSELENFNKYKEKDHLKMISFIKEIPEYRDNIALIDSIKEIIIFSEKQETKELAISLYDNNIFNNEKKIINNKGEEKIKIINTLPFVKKFESLKVKLSKSYKHSVFLLSLNKKEEAELLFNELNEKNKILNSEETLYKIIFYIKTGNKIEANNTFSLFIEKTLEKKFKENIKSIKVKPSEEKNIGDIYSLGAYLNYKNKELYELYKSRSYFFYKDNNINFDYLLAKYFKLEESYIESSNFFENLSLKDDLFKNELLEVYLLASKKSYFNNNYDVAWVNSRKGLLLQNEILKDKENKENKEKNTLILIELKKYLKESSLYYIQELIDKGEHGHSSRIQKETLYLLSKRIN